jgi:hypothetical protein
VPVRVHARRVRIGVQKKFCGTTEPVPGRSLSRTSASLGGAADWFAVVTLSLALLVLPVGLAVLVGARGSGWSKLLALVVSIGAVTSAIGTPNRASNKPGDPQGFRAWSKNGTASSVTVCLTWSVSRVVVGTLGGSGGQ